MLIHTDYETVGLKGMRHQQARGAQAARRGRVDWPAAATDLAEGRTVSPTRTTPSWPPTTPGWPTLAAKGPKTWRNRESVVARRAQ